jgi:membrane protein DedA with SNARE-associated domain
MIVAGALVRQGEFSTAAVLTVAVAGSLLGDLPWFAAGRAYGHRVLGVLCRVAIEPDSCVKQTESNFERWGAPSLMVAKFVPGFATVAPPVAGAMRLSLPQFLAYSAIGALLWAGAAVAAGIVFHAQVDWAIQRLAELGPLAALLVGLAVGLYMALKWMQRRMFVRKLRMARISASELRALLGSPEWPVILDVRSPTARKLDPQRIPGAIEVDIEAPERLGPVPPPQEIVIYCT